MSQANAASDEEKRRQIDAFYAKSKTHFPEVEDVTADEARRLIEASPERVVVVDVRNPEERQVSMIEGAVTSEDFLGNPADYQGKTVLTYCTVGHRSGLFARQLQDQGWTAFNMKGAILSWTHAGGPLVDANGPTRRVHVFGPTWNLIADGYEPVW